MMNETDTNLVPINLKIKFYIWNEIWFLRCHNMTTPYLSEPLRWDHTMPKSLNLLRRKENCGFNRVWLKRVLTLRNNDDFVFNFLFDVKLWATLMACPKVSTCLMKNWRTSFYYYLPIFYIILILYSLRSYL